MILCTVSILTSPIPPVVDTDIKLQVWCYGQHDFLATFEKFKPTENIIYKRTSQRTFLFKIGVTIYRKPNT